MNVFGTDYDGVVINIEPAKARAFGDVLHKEWGVKREKAVDFWRKSGGSSRKYKFDYFYQQQFGISLNDSEYRRVEGGFSRLLKTEFYPKTTLLPQVLDMLRFARSNFDYLFISSGVPMAEIEDLAAMNGVADTFDLVLGTSSEFPTKREHFKKVIREQKPDLMIFVADGLEDMKVAKEFEVVSIGVTTNRPASELREAGATYVCRLNQLVMTMNKILIERKAGSDGSVDRRHQ